MKYLVRLFLFDVFALWLTSQLLPAMVILGNWQVIMLAGFVLGLLMLILHPLLKILFIPINFLTLGLASWFIHVIILYVLTVIVPQVQVREWTFPGANWSGFVIPSIHLNYFLSLTASAFLIAFISNFLHKVSEE